MSLIRRIITRENSTAHFVQPIRYHFMTPIRDTSGIDSSQRLRFVTAICRPRVVGLPSCESKGGDKIEFLAWPGTTYWDEPETVSRLESPRPARIKVVDR